MEYRLLGGSGCVVSALGLGAMTLGAELGHDESLAVLDSFVENGGTLVDTADVYGSVPGGTLQRGGSEEVIGSWLAERPAEIRDRVVLATKARFPMDDTPNGGGLSARHLHQAVDASLRRLGVDTIDLFQAHAYDPLTPIEETVRTFDALVRSGKIRYYGLSNFLGWQLTRAVWTARQLGLVEPVTYQVQHNLLTRAVEWEALPAAYDAGLGILPWSPLAGGWLSGKYRREKPPPASSRFAVDRDRGLQLYEVRRSADATWRVLEALQQVADRLDEPPAKVAVAWVLGRPYVSSVLVGVRNRSQLDAILSVASMVLSPADVDLLDRASDPADPGYPYDAGARWQRTRRLEGGR